MSSKIKNPLISVGFVGMTCLHSNATDKQDLNAEAQFSILIIASSVTGFQWKQMEFICFEGYSIG